MNSRADCRVPAPVAMDHGSWHASLALGFGLRAAKRGSVENTCALLSARHRGPLYVQRAFYPEGPELAHVYLLHPPGGLVSGDHLEVALNLGAGCRVLCTTPGAARLYRARDGSQLQRQVNRLQVGPQASLEWLPQETLVYRGAQAVLETRVELAAGACFMGWEIVALGLRASAVPFDRGVFRQRFSIISEGVPLFVERMQVNGEDPVFLQGAAALGGRMTSGCFVSGPFGDEPALQDVIARIRQLPTRASALAGVTVLGDFAVVRYLGDCSEEARQLFLVAWELLRPLLLGRPACRPRIWTT